MNNTSDNHQAPVKTFRILGGGEEATVGGRARAIVRAKSLSRDCRNPVQVERTDQKVSMSFRNGRLLEYRFNTR